MWKFSEGSFPLPNIPLFNWEELGKMDSSVLRTLRYITFGRYTPSYDGAYFLDKGKKMTEEGEMYLHELDSLYPMLLTEDRTYEEWPSEKWNFQDNYGKSIEKVHAKRNPEYEEAGDESEESVPVIEEKHLREVLTSVKGIGEKKSSKILKKYEPTKLVVKLEKAPEELKEEFKWFKNKMLKQLKKAWEAFKQKL